MGIMLKFEGVKALQRAVVKLGKVPQKCVTKAAKSGATIVLKAARKKAPYDSGDLRKGIILKGEKLSVNGKKVYDITLDAAMNDIFQKTTKSGKRKVKVGRKTKVATGNYYYPASQEFGFIAKNGRYIPGYHYLKDSLTENNKQVETKILTVVIKEIDKSIGRSE